MLVSTYFIKLKKYFIKRMHYLGRQEKDEMDLFIKHTFITQILYSSEE